MSNGSELFIYAAELFCGDCGRDIRRAIDGRPEGGQPAEPQDEDTYDSGDYPKGPTDAGDSETDSLSCCGHCGVLLEEGLTAEGMASVTEWLLEVIMGEREPSPFLESVAEHLDSIGFEPEDYDGRTLLKLYELRAEPWRKAQAKALKPYMESVEDAKVLALLRDGKPVFHGDANMAEWYKRVSCYAHWGEALRLLRMYVGHGVEV